MKSLKMLMMAALTILTISVFAQSNSTRSKKEQMKMEVMKTYNSPVQNDIKSDMPGKNKKGGSTSSLSSKEQMKMEVMRGTPDTQYQNVAVDKSSNCPLCMTLLNGTPKEQMKMKVMGYKCPMKIDTAGKQPGRCSMCGMD